MNEIPNKQTFKINKMDETLNEQTPEINEMDGTSNEQTSETNVVPGNEDIISSLPAQYSSGNAGFFNRQNESVPTAVTVGPDGALYASELSALPYPEGYARVLRIGEPEGDASFDGTTPGGVSQIHSSGFEQLNGLTFDGDGALYALEYVNGSTVYDPTLPVEDLPPSNLIHIDPDGTREQISGEELRFGNYVFAHEGKIYAAIGNGDINNGQVLAYEQDADGEWSYEVVAENLNNPRGMDIGPDGNLYILEAGEGTPADDPNVEDALSIQFIPGLVSQRAGYTGSITRLDLENGEQERVYEGLPSTIEYDPNTGEDRIVSIGPNGLAIGDDGTVWIASGGGLSVESAEALGEFGEGLRGVLKLDGLFGEDPSQATWNPAFDAVEYAAENSPDGATTLFNTQSNLNDIEIGSDGNLYAVDAARNVMYGLSPDGEEVESVTVLQKTPPVLTPPQYGLVTQAGGDPSADYQVEIGERTFKGENELPDTPGRQQALENEPIASTEGDTDSEMSEGTDAEAEAPQNDAEMNQDTDAEAEAETEASQNDAEMNQDTDADAETPDYNSEESANSESGFGGDATEGTTESEILPGDFSFFEDGQGEMSDLDLNELLAASPFAPLLDIPGIENAEDIFGSFDGDGNPFADSAGEMPEEMNGETSSYFYQWDFPSEESASGEDATSSSINYTVNNLFVFEDGQLVGNESSQSSDQSDTPDEQQASANDSIAPNEEGADSEMTEETSNETPEIDSEMTEETSNETPEIDGEMTEETSNETSDSPSQPDSFEESANGDGEPPLRGEDASIGDILGGDQSQTGNEDSVDEGQITADRPTLGDPMLEPELPENGDSTEVPGFDPTMPPTDDLDANNFDPSNPGLVPGAEQSVLIPGPVDSIAPVVTEGNPFADYFDPFFGVHAPTEGDEPVLQNGENSYTVDDLYVFGDRLTENGGEFGKNSVAESTGANPPFDEAPYSETGNFTDGSNWTTYLASILGIEDYDEQDTNFSYLDATARDLINPIDPFGEATELNTFAGQVDTFEETYGTFTEDDLVIVNFGGNDLTLPPEEGVAPEEAAQQSIQATVDGIADLQELGAENFLVGLVPPVELAPIFSDPEFLGLLGVEPGFFDPIIEGYNQGLTAALEAYEVESGANIEILDTNSLFDSIAQEPGAYGFVNVDEPVLSSQTPVTGEPIAYNEEIVGEDPAVQHSTLFLDPYFHPTALGHSIIAETARDGLLNSGEASSGSASAMTGITVGLYDTDTDTLIASLENGTQIEASEVAGRNLTISVSVLEDSTFSEAQSMLLDLNDGQVATTENVEPYAVFGDNDGDYFNGGVDLQGEHTLAFELYSQDELGGEMLGNIEIDFSIV